MNTKVDSTITTYEDFIKLLHWHPVTLTDGSCIDEYKINSDLVSEEYFILREDGLFLHQVHSTDSIGGRVTNISNTYFNTNKHLWMIYDITNEKETRWHSTLSQAIAEQFTTSNPE